MMMSAHLNDKAIQLHKPLASLLAHAVEINKHHCDKKLGGGLVYSEHTVWCLRQELTYMEQFQDPNLPEESAFVVRFSFPQLLVILFWLGMIMLSFFTQTNKDPAEMTDTDFVLADPLRLTNNARFDV